MNFLKEAFHWLATLALLALCALCWLFLLIVSPFIPDIDKRAGLKPRKRPAQRKCPLCADRAQYYDLIYGETGSFVCPACQRDFSVEFHAS